MKYDEHGNFQELSDKQILRKVWKWVAICTVAITALSLVGWQIGWWFKTENTKRQVELDFNNKGTQTAWRDEAVKTVADYELIDPSNTAARGALRNKACDLIPRLSDDYRTEALDAFYEREC